MTAHRCYLVSVVGFKRRQLFYDLMLAADNHIYLEMSHARDIAGTIIQLHCLEFHLRDEVHVRIWTMLDF